MRRIVTLIIFFNSFLYTQGIKITNPEYNQKVYPGDLLEISWTYQNIYGMVKISYSNNGKTWENLSTVGVNEGSFFWLIPDDIIDDE